MVPICLAIWNNVLNHTLRPKNIYYCFAMNWANHAYTTMSFKEFLSLLVVGDDLLPVPAGRLLLKAAANHPGLFLQSPHPPCTLQCLDLPHDPLNFEVPCSFRPCLTNKLKQHSNNRFVVTCSFCFLFASV